MEQETIEGLLKRLDDIIVRREHDYHQIDSEYKQEDGSILSKEYPEYQQRKKAAIERANREALDCQQKLDALCRKIRARQPALIDLDANDLNRRGRIPRSIALGKYHVQYENLDFFVPKMFRFPFENPMYITDDNQTELFHKILLRLMYALPADKQEYYVFDPIGMGKSVWVFNQLLSNKKLFPQCKVLTSSEELKAAMQDISAYMASLYFTFFSIGNDCPDWDSCNRRFYSQRNYQKMLPYKIFIFMGVPDEMDADCFSMFQKIVLHGAECGFLVLFSFNDAVLMGEDSKMRAQELQLRKLIDRSLPLHAVLDRELCNLSCTHLQIENVGENFPNRLKLHELLNTFAEEVEKDDGSYCSFDRMLSPETRFCGASARKLRLPCGYAAAGGSELVIEIGDKTPHYLIGGTTGSGKSNLLHNIIVSALWNYNPNELRLYLLDFKEGVEFSRYAAPTLPGIALVAVEADTEYGISVLKHLNQEKASRYARFKQSGCKDIQAYRELHPDEPMPRLLVVIDEFQVLFEGNERVQTIEAMTTLAKQGRACGIHMILATQTLKGVEFGSLGTQFSGRIALNCPVEDSKLFLGGMTASNEAAAELEIPYAIINTAQGIPSKNVKFAVPEAKSESITARLTELAQESTREGFDTPTKIFEGQKFPKLPSVEFFHHDNGLSLTLGEILTYDAKPLTVTFRPVPENNLFLCGHDPQMKDDFLNAILLSVLGCHDCESIVYIGQNLPERFQAEQKITVYADVTNFVDARKDGYFGQKGFVILDSANLARSVGFPPTNYAPKNEYFASFKQFWEDANRKSTHIIALYDGSNHAKGCGIPLADFQFRIGYDVSMEEYNSLTGNSAPSIKTQIAQRAFFVKNQAIAAWFRPYR